MKSFVAGLFALLAFSACAPSGGNGGGGLQPEPARSPKPERPVAWGELSCQRRKSCADPVLNQALDALVFFFREEFAQEISGISVEEKQLSCGRKTERAWRNRFPSAEQDSRVDDLLLRILDISNCTLQGDLDVKLLNYFKNSKEYKDENH